MIVKQLCSRNDPSTSYNNATLKFLLIFQTGATIMPALQCLPTSTTVLLVIFFYRLNNGIFTHGTYSKQLPCINKTPWQVCPLVAIYAYWKDS